MIRRVSEFRGVMIDGRRYHEGDLVDVPEDMARALEAQGIIEPQDQNHKPEKQERRK